MQKEEEKKLYRRVQRCCMCERITNCRERSKYPVTLLNNEESNGDTHAHKYALNIKQKLQRKCDKKRMKERERK